MKVYLLYYEHGDYSDYQLINIGIFSTRTKAQQRVDKVREAVAIDRDYVNAQTQALVDAGLATRNADDTENIRKFWKDRSDFIREYGKTHKHPAAVRAVTGQEYFPYDAEWKIEEYEIDA